MSSAFPHRLADVPTGPGLSGLLASIELGAVPDDQLLALLTAQARQLSYQQAQLWATMAEIAARDRSPGYRTRRGGRRSRCLTRRRMRSVPSCC